MTGNAFVMRKRRQTPQRHFDRRFEIQREGGRGTRCPFAVVRTRRTALDRGRNPPHFERIIGNRLEACRQLRANLVDDGTRGCQ
jgi:hypothetical protein